MNNGLHFREYQIYQMDFSTEGLQMNRDIIPLVEISIVHVYNNPFIGETDQ